MRVRFLMDFRGKLTREQFFLTGEEGEFPDQIAQTLIDDRRAEAVVPEAPQQPPTPRRERKKRDA